MERLKKNGLIGQQRLLSSSQKYIDQNCATHFHDFYEIEYVIGGNGRCIINETASPCVEGMLFFLTPLDSHTVETDGAEIINIMFSEQLVDFRHLEPFLRHSVLKAVCVPQEMRAFVENILTEILMYEDDPTYSAALMECLLLKLARLVSHTTGNRASSTFLKMHGYIINHYRSDKLNLETVSAHVGLTPSYVSALFKKEMQIGMKAYIQSLRLEYAKKLLISTEESVRQICEESGFEDYPNFIKQFKAYHKMTPMELRKSWLGTRKD